MTVLVDRREAGIDEPLEISGLSFAEIVNGFDVFREFVQSFS